MSDSAEIEPFVYRREYVSPGCEVLIDMPDGSVRRVSADFILLTRDEMAAGVETIEALIPKVVGWSLKDEAAEPLPCDEATKRAVFAHLFIAVGFVRALVKASTEVRKKN